MNQEEDQQELSNTRKLSNNYEEEDNVKQKVPMLTSTGEDSQDVIRVPPDGGWGWLVVVGATSCIMLLATVAPCFGVLFGERLEDMGASPSMVAWMLNSQFMCWNIGGPLCRPLSRRWGYRRTAFLGAFCVSTFFFTAIFINSPILLLFTFSILTGAGGGLAVNCSLFLTAQYFEKRLGIANGIAQTGASLGIMLIPQLSYILQTNYGFTAATLLMGAITLNAAVGTLFYHPVEIHLKSVSSSENNYNPVRNLELNNQNIENSLYQSEISITLNKDLNMPYSSKINENNERVLEMNSPKEFDYLLNERRNSDRYPNLGKNSEQSAISRKSITKESEQIINERKASEIYNSSRKNSDQNETQRKTSDQLVNERTFSNSFPNSRKDSDKKSSSRKSFDQISNDKKASVYSSNSRKNSDQRESSRKSSDQITISRKSSDQISNSRKSSYQSSILTRDINFLDDIKEDLPQVSNSRRNSNYKASRNRTVSLNIHESVTKRGQNSFQPLISSIAYSGSISSSMSLGGSKLSISKSFGSNVLESSLTLASIPEPVLLTSENEAEGIEKSKCTTFRSIFMGFYDGDPCHLFVAVIACLSTTTSLNCLALVPLMVGEAGYSLQDSATAMSVVAGADMVSRIVFAMVADQPWTNIRLMYNVGQVLQLVVLLVLTISWSQWWLVLSCMAVQGVCLALLLSIEIVMMVRVVGTESLQSVYSVSQLFKAIAFITVGPCGGILRSTTGDYSVTLVFFSCLQGFGLMLAFVHGRCQSRYRK